MATCGTRSRQVKSIQTTLFYRIRDINLNVLFLIV
jgi:hypothetical protein